MTVGAPGSLVGTETPREVGGQGAGRSDFSTGSSARRSAVPFLLYTYAVARLPASHTGLLLNLIPVFGILAAVVLLDEHLMVTQLLGAGLVVVGLGAAQLGATRG